MFLNRFRFNRLCITFLWLTKTSTYQLHGLKQQKLTLSQFWRSSKSSYRQGHTLTVDIRREFSSSLQVLGSVPHSWLFVGFQSHHSNLCLLICLSNLLPMSALVIGLRAHPYILENHLHLKILSYICQDPFSKHGLIFTNSAFGHIVLETTIQLAAKCLS